ncbi:MAG: decarboxylating 6-phosphogluconate dehydrogenase [Desulfuromonadaceae bacterium]|nr:decarboxylating 6-phosphogluconate dehydrogenase [Desulfuromonadaceae bacterium]
MQLGMVGLGRMGLGMVRRLVERGHEVVVWNRSADKVSEAARYGATVSSDLHDMIEKLTPPRVVWLMLPESVVDDYLDKIAPWLEAGDCLVDGGNSHYKKDIQRFDRLKQQGLRYVDAGVSGGIWGLDVGYCLMVGGEKEVYEKLEPIFIDLAPPQGCLYCGPAGAGHFTKMIHNGIEYGMMQAYSEGFALIHASPYAEQLNFAELARLWNQGSVVRSWLLELLERAFVQDPRLEQLSGYVDDSGEGRWTVEQAIETAVATPVIAAALFQRFQSRTENSFNDRVLAALRQQFGGHAVRSGLKE